MAARNTEKISEEGRNIIIENKRGALFKLNFSENFQLASAERSSGAKCHFRFDDDDRPIGFELANQESVTLGYKDDLPTIVGVNGQNLEIFYNKDQQISRVIFPDQRGFKFEYDDNQKLIALTNRAGEVRRYSTSIEDGKLVHELVDPLGRVTQLKMDTYGGIENLIFPDGSTIDSRYDDEFDVEIIKLRNGKEKRVYSDGIHIERIEWQDGNYRSVDVNDSNQIEGIGNPSGEIAYKYSNDKLSSESFNDSEITYTYDDDLLQVVKYPSELAVTYEYSENEELSLVKVNSDTLRYDYDSLGNLDKIIYPNGLVEYQKNLSFSGIQESRITNANGDHITSQIYSYDFLGRLIRYNNYAEGVNQDLRLNYDHADRLTHADDVNSSYSENFSYDKKGNIVRSISDEIAYGDTDEIRSFNGISLPYDLAGNLLGYFDKSRGELNFTYGDDGTLATAQVGNEVWEYFYDGLGRRVGKSNRREQFRYSWSGEKLLSEEYKNHNETIIRDYVYAESNIPVAFVENGKTYWMHRDIRGAITNVSDSNGHLVWTASYTAFGEAVIIKSQIRQPWRLNGHYFDDETGLHYNVARYYSVTLRSYLSLDPKWLLFGATNYSYAANDPYNKIDTDGNLPEWVNTANIASIGAGIIAGAIAGGSAVAAGAAIASAIGISAPAIAIAAGSLAALAVVGALSGAVAGLVESIVKDKLEGKEVCWECAANAAKTGAALGLVLGPVGKVFVKATRILPNKWKLPIASLAKHSKYQFESLTSKAGLFLSKVQRIRRINAIRYYFKAAESSRKWGKNRIKNHVAGIDFSQKVEVVIIPKGTTLIQYQKLGDPIGNYFAIPGTPANKLGIDPTNKVIKVFVTTKDVEVLKSSTSSIKDVWSSPGKVVITEGGGTQFFIIDPINI
ncbi:RHS repeat-associated core domain-containing protein [Dyadobacter psychrophilus]|uniref:RHS repeat-associated core domain-containing protein n=1 Tax=Dyadobacter psychrophilus TaxID=651661 RepID=A0A1T5BKL5_9BACT|nr:RHS repeat-associated core domain-containing protein [Dyadobacter psychrophilus]